MQHLIVEQPATSGDHLPTGWTIHIFLTGLLTVLLACLTVALISSNSRINGAANSENEPKR